MKSAFAEWLWRLAVLAVLGCIAWQLQRLREDVNQPQDAPAQVAADDDVLDGLDAVRGDLDDVRQKIDAILVVMARGK